MIYIQYCLIQFLIMQDITMGWYNILDNILTFINIDNILGKVYI